MAYAPRRRGGIAKEVSSFATAFTQGMKLFSDDERGGRRSRANDPYSDENLAKRDERLGSTSALGKFFGRGENELSGFDRGRAALEEKMRIAAERGDASAYQKFAAERVLLEKQAANPAVGEKWNTPPAPAKSETPTRPAVPATPPARAATPPAQPPATPTTPPATPATPPATPVTPPATPVTPPAAPADRSGDTFEPTPPGGNAPTLQRQSAVDTDTVTQPPAIEKPVTENAVYEWNPDKGSIFDSGSGAVDYDMGVNLARGGAVPTMYAARGASVTDRMGDTGGALNMNDVANRGAFYTGDNTYGEVEGPPEEGEEPGSPTMYKPEGPAIEDGEAAGRTANLNLPRDPEALADEAAPAIAAGMDRIQAELKPSGAISTEDPAYQEKLQKFARGEGRMSEEEIKQLDSVIDPDGKLPPSSRSAARIAAIYKFYQDRGEPDTARDVAARVILYDKFASQTRGAMALQALKDGDTESGVKLLEDAYNQNMPDGKTLKATVNADGTVSFNIGWDTLTGFKTAQEGRATRQDLIQLASNTASGTEQMQRFTQAAQSTKKGGGTGAAATNRAQAAASAETFTGNLGAVEAAAKGVVAARAGDDPDAVKAAEENLRAAVAKAQGGARSVNELNQRNTMLRNTINGVITPGAVAGTRAPAATSGNTKEDRAARAEEARLADLDRRERALRADISSSPIVEQEEVDRIRSGLQAIQLERADIAAGRAPKREAFSNKDPEAFKKRTAPVNEALDAYLEEVRPEAASGKADTKTLPDIKGNLRRRFVDTADRLLAVNDMNPDTLVRSLYDMTQKLDVTPRLTSDGKGGMILAVGSERLVVDRDTYRRIAEMRGERLSEARRGNLEAFTAKQAAEQKARETAVLPIDREQAATGMNMKIQSGTDLIEPALTPSGGFFQRKPPTRYPMPSR
jgi:hypothetical protein